MFYHRLYVSVESDVFQSESSRALQGGENFLVYLVPDFYFYYNRSIESHQLLLRERIFLISSYAHYIRREISIKKNTKNVYSKAVLA